MAPWDRRPAQQQLPIDKPPPTGKPLATDEPPPTVVRFTEAESGVPVTLVGTMHYNPASAALAAATVREANIRDGVRAVLVELCSARWNVTAASEWNATAARARAPSLKRWLLRDEFMAAFEATMDCDADVCFDLADQDIETTIDRLASLCQQTVVEIASGPSGWRRIADDIRRSGSVVGGLAAAVKDPALLTGIPFTLLKGVASNRLISVLLLGTLTTGDVIDALDPSPPAPRFLVEVGLTLVFATTAIRAGLVGLIEERNAVLARNIRRACQRSSSRGQTEAVVAILGLAHIDGVRQILEQPPAMMDEDS